MLIEQLFRPFGYLAIRHPYKWKVDWLYPGVMALCAWLLIFIFDDYVTFFESDGFVSLVLSFIQSLPGFYIAALAAIATFGKTDIDTVLPEPTPKIKVKFRDTENLVDLTRRRFLAMLFAFLTAESITLIIFSIVLLAYGAPVFKEVLWGVEVGAIAAWCCVYFFLATLIQMVLATFWGLYYLGHKLHE